MNWFWLSLVIVWYNLGFTRAQGTFTKRNPNETQTKPKQKG